MVGLALLDDAAAPSRLLAARRSAPAVLRGLWEFPGGKVETGEGPREALARRSARSWVWPCGSAPRCRPRPGGVGAGQRARMRVLWGVLAEEGAEPAALEDHDLLAWVPLSGAGAHHLDWIPADRPIVSAVVAGAATAFAAAP